MMRILRGRRGSAMATALLFMVVLASLSLLLLSAVTVSHSVARRSERELEARLELEQIGAYFCAAEEETEFRELLSASSVSLPSEQITPDYENCTLTVKNKRGNVILYVEFKIENDEREIVRWRYSE